MTQCACGCGQIISQKAKRFVHGHNWAATRFSRYEAEDRGYCSPCWIWQGVPETNGYARVTHLGKRRLVHRLFYERFVGPIPDGLTIDHLCRTRLCCNPEHLEPVTPGENTRRVHEVRARANLRCNGGRYWSSEEIDQLKLLVRSGLTDAEVGRTLSRSKSAVTWVRQQAGMVKARGGLRALVECGK